MYVTSFFSYAAAFMSHIYDRTLENVRNEISALQRKHLHSRFWDFFKDPGRIDGMRKQVAEAISLFKVGVVV
jgi:hypothetical protein